MFCSVCGSELYDPDQKYCHNCGIGIRINVRRPQPQVKPKEYIYKTRIKPSRGYKDLKGSPFEIEGIGNHSKKCLGFGITSLAIVLIGFVIASGIFIYPFSYVLFYVFNFGGPMGFIGITILNFVGLIFGILSRVNKISAERVESDNGILKAGSYIGLIGLILNAIALSLDFLIPFIMYGVFIPIPVD
ncbi:MAG: zinc ribbon domain-containing protein [Promethearchaeota archaeon]